MLRAARGGEATAVRIAVAAGGRYRREFLPASRERRPQARGRAVVVAAGGGGVGPVGAAALNLPRSQAGLGEHGPVTHDLTPAKKYIRLLF